MIAENVQIEDKHGNVLSKQEIFDKVDELRKLVTASKRLVNLRTDDAYLLRFLHSCKFDVQYAYKKMDEFYELLEQYPEWFHTGSPEGNKNLLQKNMRLMLPERDREGRLIYLAKIGNVNPSKVTIKEVIKVDDMWLESAMDDPLTQCKGLSIIVDVSGYSMRLFQWLTPGNIKFGVRKLDTLPIKDMVIHVVNTSFLMDATVKIVWPFLSAKYKERIKFHYNDYNSLHQHISPDVLPPEYGGTGNSLNFEKINQSLLERNNEIVEKIKYVDFIISGK